MRPTPSRAATTVAVSAALLAAGLSIAPSASADSLTPKSAFTVPVDETTGKVAAPTAGADIPNVDSVKATIRAYYKATGGVSDKTASPYLTEVAGIESELSSLPALNGTPQEDKQAVVFDIDDTLLSNYDFEDKATNFNFDGGLNAAWVADKKFPAIKGMPEVVRGLAAKGYAIYAVTGRPSYQESDTIANLTQEGFTTTAGGATGLFDTDNTFTKWGTNAESGKPDTYDATEVPSYIRSGECTTFVDTAKTKLKCTTVEYKAQTRKHIEDTDGVEIVANVGDQLSDLWGGYANRAYKIPNPTYFLSSPDLDATHRGSDDQASELTLPDDYTMDPDGSSGLRVKGDQIPNIDPVRSEIRAYYNATDGIASKASSNYITEVTALARTWSTQIVAACKKGTAAIPAAKAKISSARTALSRANHRIHVADKSLAKANKAIRSARKHQQAKRLHRAKALKRHWKLARAHAVARKRHAQAVLAKTKVPGTPAAVFDADDTTLWTYDMEDGAMKFAFNPQVQNDDWVQPQRFPAVPGMPELVADVADAGCTIVGLTGRGDNQRYATIGNLAKVGYSDFRANNYYTKPATMPSYVNCASDADPTCSTIEYKSGTRKMLETQRGLAIVANLGDQFSDLIGGHADKTYKLPNPTYYLP